MNEINLAAELSKLALAEVQFKETAPQAKITDKIAEDKVADGNTLETSEPQETNSQKIESQNIKAQNEPQQFAPTAKGGQAVKKKGKNKREENSSEAMSLDSGVLSADSGIEILVKMAEKGEIDPKNVDIIDVTDKFLKTIATSPKESLRLSGKVIFHAAVFLRMKAEALLTEANNTINPPVVDDFLDFDADGGPILYDSAKQEVGRQLTFKDLEGAIVRRALRKHQPVRERKVTLEQLIAALKEAEKLEKVRQDKKPKAKIDLSGYHEVHDVDDILDLAHDEDIESTIIKIEQWISENLDLGTNIELFDLVNRYSTKRDWVEAFLAALFLSNAGKIDLEQDTFYGPLYLSLCRSVATDISANFGTDTSTIFNALPNTSPDTAAGDSLESEARKS